MFILFTDKTYGSCYIETSFMGVPFADGLFVINRDSISIPSSCIIAISDNQPSKEYRDFFTIRTESTILPKPKIRKPGYLSHLSDEDFVKKYR